MQRAFQPAALVGIPEHAFTQSGTVELTIRLQHLATEAVDDLSERGLTRLHNPPRCHIRIDYLDTKGFESVGDRGLAASDAAGDANDVVGHAFTILLPDDW